MSKSESGWVLGEIIRNPIPDVLSLSRSLGFQLEIMKKCRFESVVSERDLNLKYKFIILLSFLFSEANLYFLRYMAL